LAHGELEIMYLDINHLTEAAVMIMVAIMTITDSYIRWEALLQIQRGRGGRFKPRPLERLV
jgi:hypothetical protein